MLKQKIINILGKLNVGVYHIRPRPVTKIIENQNKKDLIGVEIGTWKGENALDMLKRLNIKKLYLIDPWEDYPEFQRNIAWKKVNRELMNNAEKETRKRLSKYKNRVVFIKGFSEKVVNKIPSELDFVYIDGNHSYNYVKKDIELYYPKVKLGGVFGVMIFKMHL